MSMREILEQEAQQIFLNDDEFAEGITLNEKPIKAQVVWLQRESSLGQTPGLALRRVRLHVSETDAPEDVTDGVVVDFNGESWTIEGSQQCFGLLVLTLATPAVGMEQW